MTITLARATPPERHQQDRVSDAPPFSLETEQAVLGSLMSWNKVLDDVHFLTEHHFYDPLNGAIFAAAKKLIAAGRVADPVTLRAQFQNIEPVNATMTVPQYLGHLVANACTARQAVDYARTIVDLAVRRWLILAGEDLVASARDSASATSPLEVIEETESRLFALAQESGQSSDVTAHTFSETASETVERAYEAYKKGFTGLRSGVHDLDAKLGGLQNSDLIIKAGRPSMGKTALATNIAFHVARTQAAVHFFSLEMSAHQLVARILGEQTEVSAQKIRSGKTSEQNLKDLAETAKRLGDVPLYIDDAGGLSIGQIAARARRMKRKKNTGLIVIDYLQLMQPSSRRANASRVQDITEITAGLKALAKELNVPILALSQLSRETEKREHKRPQLSDLRESGSIEQDADVVLFVYREEYYVEREQPPVSDAAAHAEWQKRLRACAGKAEIIIGKQRHGEIGSVPVAFSGELTRFSDLARGAHHGR